MNRVISRSVMTVSLVIAVMAIFGIACFAFANPSTFDNRYIHKVNNDDSLVCNYDFYMENKLSTIVPDISGHNNSCEIKTRGDVRSYQILEDENVLGKKEWSFQPNGGYGGTYLEVPTTAFETMTGDDAELTASI